MSKDSQSIVIKCYLPLTRMCFTPLNDKIELCIDSEVSLSVYISIQQWIILQGSFVVSRDKTALLFSEKWIKT